MLRKPAAAKGPHVVYDHDKHLYWIDGRPVPGTTAILRAAGIIDAHEMDNIPQQYRIRGTLVHEWIENIEKGFVSAAGPFPSVVDGQIRAWLKFKRDTRIKVLGSEVVVPDRLGRFATRVDIDGEMDVSEWLINLKGPGVFGFHQYQSALEAMCFRPGCRRAALHLHKEGRYNLVEFTDPGDFRVAEQAIRTYYQQQEKANAASERV